MGIPGLTPVLSELVDIGLVAFLVYWIIIWMRGARAHLALAGIGILGCVYLLASQLGLVLTASIFQAFFAVFLIVLVVIFQDELRRAFERIAVWGLRRSPSAAGNSDPMHVLVRAASDLASLRRGALIVLPGRDPVDRHIEGGIALDGRLSEPLLLSLFDPNSPGHDGAVVVDGDRVRVFAAHLPLSADHEQLAMRGTRHAAALGLAERTDALCVVVSEERGQVGVARSGRLEELRKPSQLVAVLRDYWETEAVSERRPRGPFRFVRENWKEMSAALGVSALLWVLVIPGSKQSETTLEIPVTVENLPPGYLLEEVAPPQVSARVRGLRRDLFFLDARRLEVRIDGFLVTLGRRTFEVSPESVRHPTGLIVTGVEPRKVVLSVERTPAGEPGDGKGRAPGEESR